MKILLLGSSGLLGTLIKKFLEGNEKYQLQDYSKQTESSKYDFSKKINLFCIADSFKPEVIINAIGLTNVDYCERNPHEAFVINARVVENISQWIIEKSPKTHLIHISTDHLYDSNICHKDSDIKLSN
jgi:dTDP-4-dehydrorhamnose reductase